ncbi:dTDP-4-dehydrorhamnose 3,5-epimerase [Myxococcota bacterium]|nr:dTDP-4-dehydrorhamnose 3,5-epimerase [Myxococcota bacterium]
MEFVETKLAGAWLVRQKKIVDARGHFARVWCTDEFRQHGLEPTIVQINTGLSVQKGTLRGMHYQLAPHAEAKFMRCTRGAIFDVIVDLRPGSATRGQWVGYELTADNGDMLYAPPGFAHGYQTLCADAEMYYTTSAMYAGPSARGVRYDDPAFGITWPLPVTVISDADRNWPSWNPALAGEARS